MVDRLGFDWTCLVLMPTPLIFYKYGPELRAKSRYMPKMEDESITSSECGENDSVIKECGIV